MVRKQYAVTCVQLARWIQVNLSGQVLHIIWTQLCRKLCCEPGGAWSDDSLISLVSISRILWRHNREWFSTTEQLVRGQYNDCLVIQRYAFCIKLVSNYPTAHSYKTIHLICMWFPLAPFLPEGCTIPRSFLRN